jgi:YD repeat-containing protein
VATGIGIFTKLLPFLSDGQQVPPQVDARGRLIVSSGDNNTAGVLTVTTVELDTNAGIAPTWKAHAYTYDGSNNLKTDTITDGTNIWVKTFVYENGYQVSDSGWVKQ